MLLAFCSLKQNRRPSLQYNVNLNAFFPCFILKEGRAKPKACINDEMESVVECKSNTERRVDNLWDTIAPFNPIFSSSQEVH